MKRFADAKGFTIRPYPVCVVSCRDKEGRNNALVVGCAGNASSDEPSMLIAGIIPTKYSYHMIKETGCFVMNFYGKKFQKESDYLGKVSGWDEDKFAKLGLKWKDGEVVNAPILTDCPVSIECTVVDSIKPGSHELFIGKVEKIWCDEEFLDAHGKVDWNKVYAD